MSLAICDYIDFNATEKTFWLFDTFDGIPLTQISQAERALGRASENRMYPECFEVAKKNFARYERARLVRGCVPDTFATVEIQKVAYLMIDMNIVEPERAALNFFWDKMVSGGIVLFDDYGWTPYAEQKAAHDLFARSRGVEILTLPTGQGMLLKP